VSKTSALQKRGERRSAKVRLKHRLRKDNRYSKIRASPEPAGSRFTVGPDLPEAQEWQGSVNF
jgi:hypothetical protein